jgi:NADPH-dependent 2,4-dienoyl-CoA reductase/sulfur reductase-like enzyme
MTRTPVLPAVVVGAGPYGLSVAAHLRGLGVPVRVFGEPMSSWRYQMPAGMYLKSHADAASLSSPEVGHTLLDYCRHTGTAPFDDEHPVPVETFISYGLWFADRLLPDVERVRVRELRRRGDVIELSLDTGEDLVARSVVVATGLEGYPYIPREIVGLASHTSQHHDLTGFAGSDVIVIGAGQSALEGATLLHEAGSRVRLVARQTPSMGRPARYDEGRALSTLLQPHSKLGHGWALQAYSSLPGGFRHLPKATRRRLVGRVLGPYGSSWLRERFEGRVPIHVGSLTGAAAAPDGRVRLELASDSGQATTLTADHVIAGTGFRVNLDRLDFLAASTRAAIATVHGSPRLTARFESSAPGLFFVGHAAAMTFGPVMRFVCGAGYAARRTSAAVAARVR